MAGHAIITGGSSGIGLAFAKNLASQGISVSLIARDQNRLNAARAVVEGVAANGAKVACFSTDVRVEEDCTGAVERACATLGPPSWGIACAGIAEPGLFLDQPLSEYEDQMRTNYLGSLYFAHAVARRMVASGSGNLVFVSSGAAFAGLYGYSAYGASKFAVRGLAESLHVELKGSGVQVSLVYPGDTDTPQLHYELKHRPKVTEIIAGPARILTPEEVAKASLMRAKSGKFLVTFGWRLILLSQIHSLIGSPFRKHQIRVAQRAAADDRKGK